MNKRVLVTGSTKGIGKAVAEKFHSQGWDVGITARGQADISAIADLLNEKRSNSAIGIKADLSSSEEIRFLRQTLEREWKKLDCVIFNVGTGKNYVKKSDSQESIDVKSSGNFYVNQNPLGKSFSDILDGGDSGSNQQFIGPVVGGVFPARKSGI